MQDMTTIIVGSVKETVANDVKWKWNIMLHMDIIHWGFWKRNWKGNVYE